MGSKNIFIIAEAGVNHNGSLDMAKKLVDVACEAGADAVKFQTYKTEHIVSKWAEKAQYQKQTTDENETQFEMIKNLELNGEAHMELIEYCNKNIEFLSSPFDLKSVDLLAKKLKLKRLKIPSGEITNAPLLLKISQTGLPVILSTGMATLAEVETALSILAFGYINGENTRPSQYAFRDAYSSNKGRIELKEKVSLLHCTTEYPTPFYDVNLKAMDTLKAAFGLPVGYSDHTLGLSVSLAAAARGACVIEKHFTLDRDLPGPDHKASLQPEELKKLISGIREVEFALGSPIKIPVASEYKNMAVARKSLVAGCAIRKEEYFTEANLSVKRPGNGISPLFYWDWIGKKSAVDYENDELIY